MDQDEERQFLESLTLRIWKARADGAIIGAAFVLGIGFLLYLAAQAGPLIERVLVFSHAGDGIFALAEGVWEAITLSLLNADQIQK